MSSHEPWNVKVFKELSKATKLKKVDYGDLEKTCREKGFDFEVFAADKLEKLTFTYFDSPKIGLTIHSVAAITNVTKYELPMLVYLNIIGPVYTMVEADLVPLRPYDEDYRKKYIKPMASVHDKHKDLPGYDANPSDWWKELSSHHDYHARGKWWSENMQKATDVVMDYFNLWLKFYREAKPVEDPELLRKAAERKKFVKELMLEHDPGKGVLTRVFGAETAHKLDEIITF